jgi:hypothetical protein
MNVEKLVEKELAEKHEVVGEKENCHIVHYKSYAT